MTRSDIQERLTAIEARLTAATPGPWRYAAEIRPLNEFAHYSIQTVDPDANAPWSQRFIAWMTGGKDIAANVFAGLDRYDRDKLIDAGVRPDHRCKPDADMIANAPTDVRFLLDLARGSLLDSERLDWLERCNFVQSYDDVGSAIFSHNSTTHTLRQAIDAAKDEDVRRVARDILAENIAELDAEDAAKNAGLGQG